MKLQNLLNSTRLERSLKRAVEREERFIPGLWKNSFSSKHQTFPAFYPIAQRGETLQWLQFLNYSVFKFCPETYALAVNVFDRFLCVVKVQGKHIRCIAAASLLIAAKICQEPENEPSADEIVSLGGCSFTRVDVTRMERIMLHKLNWDVDASTPLNILNLLHSLAWSFGYLSPCTVNGVEHLRKVTAALERCMLDVTFASCKPSVLALAVLSDDLRQLPNCDWLEAMEELRSLASMNTQMLSVYYEQVQSFLARGSPRVVPRSGPKPIPSHAKLSPKCLFSSPYSPGSMDQDLSLSVSPMVCGETPPQLSAVLNSASQAVSSDSDSILSDDSDSDCGSPGDSSGVAGGVVTATASASVPLRPSNFAKPIKSDLTYSAACAIFNCVSVPKSCGLSQAGPVCASALMQSSPVKVV